MNTSLSVWPRILTISSLSIASAVGQAARAEGAGAAGEDPTAAGLEEVMVTARRSSERMQEVPIAVTAISGDVIHERGIVDMTDLNSVVPGLTVTQVNSPTSLILVIRGLGNTNPNTGSDAAVGFYMNEVPINLQNGTNLGLFDLESVQVLKGPQGTLFGRNTTGGAILINTKRPTNSFEGHIRAGGTFFEEGEGYQTEAALNLPVTDAFALRFAVSTQERDGWVKNVIDPNAGPAVFNAHPLPFGVTDFKNQQQIDSQAWRVSALWNPGDSIENLFVYSGDRISTTGLAANTTALNPAGPVVVFSPFLGVPDPTQAYAQLQDAKRDYWWSTMAVSNNPLDLSTHTFSNATSWEVAGLTLKNIMGYRRVDEEYGQDIVGLPGEYFVYRQHTGGRNFSNEFQIQGKALDDTLRWVTGLFYFEESRFTISGPTTQFSGPGGGTFFESDSRSYSVFAQGTKELKWLEGLSFTAGARYTIDEREAHVTRTVPDGSGGRACLFPGATLANCLLENDATFKKPTYTVSLDYQWNERSLVYLASRRGYRSGGFSNTVANEAGFQPFDPESVTDFELGIKKDWELANVELRTNIAVYHQEYKKIQRLVVDENDLTIQNIVNAGEATVQGGEVEITIVPVDGLELGYSFAYVDPVYDRFIDGNRDFKGATFAYAPHNTHNISVSYGVPLQAENSLIQFTADYHLEGDHFYDDGKQTTEFGPLETLRSKGYGMLNLGLAWKGLRGTALDVDVFVKNATNEKVAPNGAPTYNSFGIGISFFSVPPRMYGLNATYSFGR